MNSTADSRGRTLGPLERANVGFMQLAQGDFGQRIDLKHADECGRALNALRCVQTKLGFDMAELNRTAQETSRIKTALDHASTNVMMGDENRTIIYMNPAILRMFKNAEADMRKRIPEFDAEKLIGANMDVFHARPEHQRRLLERLDTTQDKLREVFTEIRQASDFIHHSAQEIAIGNTNLSQRAEQQAASLQETASSMEELTATVQQNAEHALQAKQAVMTARDQAEQGGAAMRRVVAAMAEISASSANISNIIGTIDEIAFQTNILTLNASVVAAEVRNLAQRSAKAAKESRELIQTSLEKVRAGSRLVEQSEAMLENIVNGVKQAGDLVAEIAASKEQAHGIQQVNTAVAQMDEITQQNAALAEQASAASLSMSDQAENMVRLIGFLKTEGSLTDRSGGLIRYKRPNPRATQGLTGIVRGSFGERELRRLVN